MPFVTFTVRRGLSAADKSRLSEARLEAQVAAGYHRADRFHRFLKVDEDDLPEANSPESTQALWSSNGEASMAPAAVGCNAIAGKANRPPSHLPQS